MTDEEIDKMADDFVNAQEFTKVYGLARKAECGAFWKYGFLAGLKSGRQWHKVADGDLPEEYKIVLCYYVRGYHENETIYGYNLFTRKEIISSRNIIAWCEIPTFDKE